ncbi:MAG: hypothetical protein QOF09_4192 [Alphaproteobacteria bacterium]|nr:hypothetical protein [Alphaproteobacteria bacterium]
MKPTQPEFCITTGPTRNHPLPALTLIRWGRSAPPSPSSLKPLSMAIIAFCITSSCFRTRSGQYDERADRLRKEEPGKTQLRIGGPGNAVASRRLALQEIDRRSDHSCSLSGHGTVRCRPAGRPHGASRRRHQLNPGVRQKRPADGVRGAVQATRCRLAGRSDRSRGRRAGLRGGAVVGHRDAGWGAAADRRKAEPGRERRGEHVPNPRQPAPAGRRSGVWQPD